MSDHIRYYYYGRTQKGNANGIITCATTLDGDKINVGFSFCSPKDMFKKDMGKRIAVGRLNSSPVTLKFTGHSGDDISNFIRTLIENDTLKVHSFPKWIKKVNLSYGIV